MNDPATPEGTPASPVQAQEQTIREQVRDLTARMLSGGQLDTDGVKAIVRTMSGGALQTPMGSDQAREAFAEAIRGLDRALQSSAQATHEALQALVARGKDFSDNDLKNAFAALQKLQEDYVATANHIADATTGNIRRELADLALHAQRVGADASVRIAQLMSEFASRMSGSYRGRAISGLEAARDYGANMTMLTSGMLAGFADALRQQSEAKKPK
jgi:phosphoribosyl-ATP pyrophosphohydrolase